jgi:hypothetical protein
MKHQKLQNYLPGAGMNPFPVLLGALCIYALAYRYYSAFIAAKALALDDRRITPAHNFELPCQSPPASSSIWAKPDTRGSRPRSCALWE